jgi:hypothetical protein
MNVEMSYDRQIAEVIGRLAADLPGKGNERYLQ